MLVKEKCTVRINNVTISLYMMGAFDSLFSKTTPNLRHINQVETWASASFISRNTYKNIVLNV